MPHSFEELKHKTIDELREIAKGLDQEAVKGFTQMNKEHLLPAICKVLGIEAHKHPHHAATGIDKPALKARLAALKAEKERAVEAGDRNRLKSLRREHHRINRRIRAASL